MGVLANFHAMVGTFFSGAVAKVNLSGQKGEGGIAKLRQNKQNAPAVYHTQTQKDLGVCMQNYAK